MEEQNLQVVRRETRLLRTGSTDGKTEVNFRITGAADWTHLYHRLNDSRGAG